MRLMKYELSNLNQQMGKKMSRKLSKLQKSVTICEDEKQTIIEDGPIKVAIFENIIITGDSIHEDIDNKKHFYLHEYWYEPEINM